MALQNFVDRVGPTVSAAWLNVVDYFKQIAATAGTDTYTLSYGTLTATPFILENGVTVNFQMGSSNTGASTLNVHGSGAVPLAPSISPIAALRANELRSGALYQARYISGVWQLQTPTRFFEVLRPDGRPFINDNAANTLRLGGGAGEGWTLVSCQYTATFSGVDANGVVLAVDAGTTASAAFGNFRVVNSRAGNGSNVLLHLTNTIDANYEVNVSETGAASKFVRIGPTVAIPLDLKTNNVSRIRIEGNTGRVLVGTTTNFGGTATMDVEGAAAAAIFARNNAGAGASVGIFWNMATAGDNIFCQFVTEGAFTLRGSITYNRGAGLTAYNTTSDKRLKNTISRGARNFDTGIDRIEVHEFAWKESGYRGIGCYAQELQVVAPEAVTAGDEGETVGTAWGVDYSKLVPRLVLEIQHLRRRVAALEARGNGNGNGVSEKK